MSDHIFEKIEGVVFTVLATLRMASYGHKVSCPDVDLPAYEAAGEGYSCSNPDGLQPPPYLTRVPKELPINRRFQTTSMMRHCCHHRTTGPASTTPIALPSNHNHRHDRRFSGSR